MRRPAALEERERRLAAPDSAITRGIADAAAGRVEDAASVFDTLQAQYDRMVAERNTA
jgi:antitoxin ParD1/3/4